MSFTSVHYKAFSSDLNGPNRMKQNLFSVDSNFHSCHDNTIMFVCHSYIIPLFGWHIPIQLQLRSFTALQSILVPFTYVFTPVFYVMLIAFVFIITVVICSFYGNYARLIRLFRHAILSTTVYTSHCKEKKTYYFPLQLSVKAHMHVHVLNIVNLLTNKIK